MSIADKWSLKNSSHPGYDKCLFLVGDLDFMKMICHSSILKSSWYYISSKQDILLPQMTMWVSQKRVLDTKKTWCLMSHGDTLIIRLNEKYHQCLNMTFTSISAFFVQKFLRGQTSRHIFKTWSLCFILIDVLHFLAPWKSSCEGRGEMAHSLRWQLYVALCLLTCVSLIIREHGVAFDSMDTLTAHRLAKASRMTVRRSEETGWKAGVQLREDQRRRNFNHSHCVRAQITQITFFIPLVWKKKKSSLSEYWMVQFMVWEVLSNFDKKDMFLFFSFFFTWRAQEALFHSAEFLAVLKMSTVDPHIFIF